MSEGLGLKAEENVTVDVFFSCSSSTTTCGSNFDGYTFSNRRYVIHLLNEKKNRTDENFSNKKNRELVYMSLMRI